MLKNITYNKITDAFAYLTVISLFFKENINTIFFILFTVSIFPNIIKNRRRINIDNRAILTTILSSSYFLLGCLGLLLNPESNGDYIVRLIPFLTIPCIVFYFSSSSSSNIVSLTFLYVISNILFLIVLDVSALIDMIQNKSLFVSQGGREYYRFLYTRYTNPDFFNHIYLSIYTFLSGIFIIKFKYPLVTKSVKRAIIVYLLFHLFMLGSRAMVIALLVGILIYLVILFFYERKYKKYLLIYFLLVCSLFFIAFAFKNTLLFNRYSQVYEWYENKEILLERNYSVNNRIKIYIIGTSLMNDVDFMGVNGSGIAEKTIQEEYEKSYKDVFPLKTNTYNTHNQYINNYIDWGILGVMLLVVLLVVVMYKLFREKQKLLLLFWIVFAIILMMECILIRQRGIILFTLVYSLCLSNYISSKQKSLKDYE